MRLNEIWKGLEEEKTASIKEASDSDSFGRIMARAFSDELEKLADAGRYTNLGFPHSEASEEGKSKSMVKNRALGSLNDVVSISSALAAGGLGLAGSAAAGVKNPLAALGLAVISAIAAGGAAEAFSPFKKKEREGLNTIYARQYSTEELKKFVSDTPKLYQMNQLKRYTTVDAAKEELKNRGESI